MNENTKAELYKMYAKAMKMMPGSSQQKELVKKIGALRKKLGMNEERDYKAEYKKFQSSTKSKKYRAELNKYNRKKGTYGNGDGKDASHKGGKIVGFESQSKNRGRAEKSRLKQESTLNENPAAIAAATAMTKIKMKNPKTGKENSAVSALKDKDNPNHKKAKGIFAKLKDRFSKKKDDKKAAPTKQTKSDADFYKRQYTGESVNEAKKPRYTKDGKRIISKSVWKRMPDYAKLRKNGVEHMLTGDPEKKGRSKYVPVQIESVNEAKIRWNAVDNAIVKYIKYNVKVLEKPIKARDEELTKKYLKGFIDGLVNAQKSLKLESVNEKISKEEWAQYPAYARKLKPYMQKLLKVPLKVRVIKQANHNPWIEVRVAKFGKDIIPNDFRVKVAKSIGASSVRDWDNVNYGGIRVNSIDLRYNEWVKLLGNKVKTESVTEEAERDYKAEYKKYGSSTKAKKYRAELNQYNRKKGTYGNGDGKDASHKGGKIVGFESQSKNRGRAEKSRLKKEDIREDIGIEAYLGGILKSMKKAGLKLKTAQVMKWGWSKSKDKIGFLINVLDRERDEYTLQIEVDRDGNLWYLSAPRDMKLGKWADTNKIVRSLKAISKLPDFGQSTLKKR